MSTELRIIVLDGFDWEWTGANREACAPLWRIHERGCSAKLNACPAPVTSDAVAALLTGQDVALQWSQPDRYNQSQDLIRRRPWLYDLAQHGLTIGLCNVPMTWPAFRMPDRCWMTAGYPVPGNARTDLRPWRWPDGLEVGGYPIDEVGQDHGPGGTKDIPLIARTEERIADWMVTKAPRCDVEIVWLRGTDSAGHHAWGLPEYEEQAAHACRMAELLSADARDVVVMSDHGFDSMQSPRCKEYLETDHGPIATRAGLLGGHTMDGILFAAGERIQQRGDLGTQQILDVAQGIYSLLGLPPAPTMDDREIPRWALATTAEDDAAIMERMRALGYA